MRWVADPHGTGGAQTTTINPGLSRSAKEVMFLGLPGATAMTRVFDAKLTGSPASRPALAALSMFVVSAEANTSADGALGQLGDQVGRAGEVEVDRTARIVGLELLADLGERLLQGGGGEDSHRLARRGAPTEPHPVSAATSIVVSTTAPIRAWLHDAKP